MGVNVKYIVLRHKDTPLTYHATSEKGVRAKMVKKKKTTTIPNNIIVAAKGTTTAMDMFRTMIERVLKR